MDASAQGLFLSWNDCWTGAGAASEATFSCLFDSGSHELVVGFSLAQPIDSIVGLEAVVDIQHADETLPDWWHFESGGCRSGRIVAGVDFSNLSGCANPWGTVGLALVQIYAPGAPRGAANQARLVAVASVSPSDSARVLESGQDYSALVLSISHAETIGPVGCAGCQGNACLVLNSIELIRLPGGTGNVVLEVPGGGSANQVTWQGAAADCGAVPVRAMPWGRLKSLYR